MANPRGFLEVHRVPAPERDAGERVRDYGEIYQTLPEEELRLQGARCMDCGVPFCNNGCPLGNLIPDWNDLVRRGDWREAIEQLHATNNFPEFTGLVCPAPCESACVLDIDDDPVMIKQIEWGIIERAWEEGWVVPRPPQTRTGRTVGVVGSCAAARPAGPDPTTATRLPVLGAVCRGAIHASSNARSTMATSIDLIATASSLIASTQAASQGAGQMRPVNSGKSFVAWSWSIASRQRPWKTRSFQSGMRLPSGQPSWQNGTPHSMQRAPCRAASSAGSTW